MRLATKERDREREKGKKDRALGYPERFCEASPRNYLFNDLNGNKCARAFYELASRRKTKVPRSGGSRRGEEVARTKAENVSPPSFMTRTRGFFAGHLMENFSGWADVVVTV